MFSPDLHWDSQITSQAYKILQCIFPTPLLNDGQVSIDLLFTPLQGSPNQTH